MLQSAAGSACGQAEGADGIGRVAAVAEDAGARLARIAHRLLPLHGIDVAGGHVFRLWIFLSVGGTPRTGLEGAADASSKMASRRKTLSRETVSDMRCRKLDAPAPRRAKVRGPPERWRRNSTLKRNATQRRNSTPKLNACDAPPDLGLPYPGRPAAGSRSSARRPRHATQATNSLCDAGLTAAAASADPPRGGRAARRYAAHFFARAARRNDCNAGASATLGDDCNADATRPGGYAIRGNARHQGHNRTLTHGRRRNGTLLDATQPGRNGTRGHGRKLDATTLIRTNARQLSNARNSHGGKTLDCRYSSRSRIRELWISSQPTDAETRLPVSYSDRHLTPPDVLFAF